jgi:hypothetical protein
MSVFNGLFPLLPGKEEAFRDFAQETLGPRRAQFAALQALSTVTRETWTLVPTPDGFFVNVWFEGNVDKAFADLATAEDEFAVWFREQVLNVTGVDMSAPNDSAPPETVFDWKG